MLPQEDRKKKGLSRRGDGGRPSDFVEKYSFLAKKMHIKRGSFANDKRLSGK
jgi:hypothetical protein